MLGEWLGSASDPLQMAESIPRGAAYCNQVRLLHYGHATQRTLRASRH